MILTNRTFTDRKSQKCETVRGKTYGGEVCEKNLQDWMGIDQSKPEIEQEPKILVLPDSFFPPNANEIQCNLI